ncbi:hypothetical protein FF38_04965 [Lucilia cuprina]|uniref:Uncharacterized protein n=1 Tax=Lucilia cuprina TaxID=7375 RepID=A0A0L0CLY1_LUCCU|nr:uncharacterized protein LOC111675817 [Lucilia cuprina]KNC32439.1 hypothetical protein FF38_04965 [Lucilia cuprina]
MKTFMVLCIALFCCLCLVFAAPVENSPGVQFLKYTDDKDFEEIQKQIIAQYENLGGTSQVHHVQTATIVDPNNLKINI